MPPGNGEHRRSRDDKEPRRPNEKTVGSLGSLFTGFGEVVEKDGKRYSKSLIPTMFTDNPPPPPKRKNSRRRRPSRSSPRSRSQSQDSIDRKHDDSRELPYRPPRKESDRRSAAKGYESMKESPPQFGGELYDEPNEIRSRAPPASTEGSQNRRRSHTSRSQREYSPEPRRGSATPRNPSVTSSVLQPNNRSHTSSRSHHEPAPLSHTPTVINPALEDDRPSYDSRSHRERGNSSRASSAIAPPSQPDRPSYDSRSHQERGNSSRASSAIAPPSQPDRQSHVSRSQQVHTPEPPRGSATPRVPSSIPQTLQPNRRSDTPSSQQGPSSYAPSQPPSRSERERYTSHDDHDGTQSELSFIAKTIVPEDSISAAGAEDSSSTFSHEAALARAEVGDGDFTSRRYGSSASESRLSGRDIETIGGRGLIEQAAKRRSSKNSHASANSRQPSTRPAPGPGSYTSTDSRQSSPSAATKPERHISTGSRRPSNYTEPRPRSHRSAPRPRSGSGSRATEETLSTTSSRRGDVVEPGDAGYAPSLSQVSSGPRFDENSDDDRPVGRIHGGRRRSRYSGN